MRLSRGASPSGPLDTKDEQSFTPWNRSAFPGGESPSSGSVARDKVARLHAKARTLAYRERSDDPVCPSCGGAAVYMKRDGDAPAMVYCGDCGEVLRTSWVNLRAKCGLLPAKGGREPIELRLYRKTDESGQVTMDTRAGVGGAMKCGSGWECPSCAQAIAMRDALTLQLCNHGFRDERPDGDVYLVTLTVPNSRGDDIETLRRGVTKAWQKLQSGKSWKLFKTRFGVMGTVRRLEVTVSHARGPHPHIHACLYCERTLTARELRKLRVGLWWKWRRACRKVEGIGRPSVKAQHVCRADRDGRYLAKMGLELELTQEQHKRGKCPRCSERKPTVWDEHTGTRRCGTCRTEVGRTPWQVLADFTDHGHERDAALWRDYCRKIRGARRLTWGRSRGDIPLREQYATWQRKVPHVGDPVRGDGWTMQERAPGKKRLVPPKIGELRQTVAERKSPGAPPVADTLLAVATVPPATWLRVMRNPNRLIGALVALESENMQELRAALWTPELDATQGQDDTWEYIDLRDPRKHPDGLTSAEWAVYRADMLERAQRKACS